MMASRAILRRKRHLLSSVNPLSRSIQGSSKFWNDHLSQHDSSSSISASNYKSACANRYAHGQELLDSSTVGVLRQNFCSISTSMCETRRTDSASPLGIAWVSQCRRTASTVAADQPKLQNEKDGDEETAGKQVKEASPEECDQAVEGLSSVKAKAKAKQIEPQKSSISILKRVWNMILGIGPALRAVASMSRFSFFTFFLKKIKICFLYYFSIAYAELY